MKELVIKELRRKAPPVSAPPIVFDLPEKAPATHNLNWRVRGRFGPIAYRDEWGDGQNGKLQIRLGKMNRIYFEIRKDFE